MEVHVKNMLGLANQFIIEKGSEVTFQSYNSKIATVKHKNGKTTLTFFKDYKYSKTTSRNRNKFFGIIFNWHELDTTKKVDEAIKNGYVNVNGRNVKVILNND